MIGQQVRSPWADAQENAQSPVNAMVTVTQGTIEKPTPSFDASVSLGVTVDLATSAATEGVTRQVVTAQRAQPGAAVYNGDVVAEISGRPVFAMSLSFPLYRDLHYGDEGPDVEAVQTSLADLGLYHAATDGSFGAATQDALTSLYRTRVVRTPAAPADQAAAVEAAESALQQLLSAPDAPADETQRARATVAEAKRAAGTWLPLAEVLSLPGPSASVASAAPVGTVLDDETTALSLRTGAPTVSGRLGVADSEQFELETEVRVELVGGDASVVGRVTSRSEFLPGEGDSLPGYDVTVTLEGTDGLGNGASVRVLPADGGGTESGLVLPLSAVRQDGEGTYVLVDAGTTSPVRVAVTPGISGHGQVIVTGEIAEGDRVVVASSS